MCNFFYVKIRVGAGPPCNPYQKYNHVHMANKDDDGYIANESRDLPQPLNDKQDKDLTNLATDVREVKIDDKEKDKTLNSILDNNENVNMSDTNEIGVTNQNTAS